MAAPGMGDSESLVDVMGVLLRQECLPLQAVYANRALYECIAAGVEVRLDAGHQRDCVAAMARTFVRKRVLKLHLCGHFSGSLQQAQPLGWSAIRSLTLHKFSGGITALPSNLEELHVQKTVLDAEMMHIVANTAPASLRSLELLWCPTACTTDDFNLPATLHTLVYARPFEEAASAQPCAKAFRRALPGGLQRLHLVNWGVPDGMPFPDSLESLFLQNCTIGGAPGAFGGTESIHGGQLLRDDRRDGVRLPAALRALALAQCDFNFGFGDLPPRLVNFTAGMCYDTTLREFTWSEYDRSSLWDTSLPVRRRKYYIWSLAPLPPGLVRLDFSNFFLYNVPLGLLPCTLEYLHMGDSFRSELGPLPASLKTLKVGKEYATPLGALPTGLAHLQLEGDFHRYSHPLGPLPHTLQHLQIDGSFDHDLGPRPSSLRRLYLQGDLAQPLPHLPEGLRQLRLGSNFNDPLAPLLSALETPCLLNCAYAHPIEPVPVSLTRVWRLDPSSPREYIIRTEYKDGVRVREVRDHAWRMRD